MDADGEGGPRGRVGSTGVGDVGPLGRRDVEAGRPRWQTF